MPIEIGSERWEGVVVLVREILVIVFSDDTMWNATVWPVRGLVQHQVLLALVDLAFWCASLLLGLHKLVLRRKIMMFTCILRSRKLLILLGLLKSAEVPQVPLKHDIMDVLACKKCVQARFYHLHWSSRRLIFPVFNFLLARRKFCQLQCGGLYVIDALVQFEDGRDSGCDVWFVSPGACSDHRILRRKRQRLTFLHV